MPKSTIYPIEPIAVIVGKPTAFSRFILWLKGVRYV